MIVGTFLAALISIPVAYGAARNTSPNGAVMAICRGIGIVSRSIPAIAFASIFVFLFALGPLPGILAFMLHSIGMISKMFADAIEQIDEGPRLAIRSTGGSKAQEFWSGVVPQVLPRLDRRGIASARTSTCARRSSSATSAWRAWVSSSRDAIHALNYRRAFPIAIAIIVLCILFEIVSSVIRSRLLGVRPTGRGLGDVIDACRIAAIGHDLGRHREEGRRQRQDRRDRGPR